MCGLVGIAGDISHNTEQMFKCLLQLDTVRGPHSTGIAAVQGGRKVVVVKGVGTPWDLAETKKWEELFRGFNKVLIGHNRWATKGRVNKVNAHPFEFDTVVGAHNGTLRSVYQLDDWKEFEVDSENIYHHMDKNGVYDTIPKLNGAFALTWYNKDDHTVNLIRNDERPLFYCFSEDMRTLMWASEEWMLLVAANASRVKLTKLFELPVGVLHTFDIPNVSTEKFGLIRTRKLELYKYVSSVVHGNVLTGAKDTKVVELRPKSSNSKTIKPYTEYQKRMNKEVMFYVGNKATTTHGQPYIQCWLDEDEDISVRVFAQEDGALWKLMMLSSNLFKGLVKSYGENEGKYLGVDLRTVEEVVPDADDLLPELFTGYDGELITERVYDERTSTGCAWCGCHVSVDDADAIKWISKREFVCPDCVEIPDVKQHFIDSGK